MYDITNTSSRKNSGNASKKSGLRMNVIPEVLE
jgi:hypothetical protein